MIRALVRKELRELAPFVALALLAQLLLPVAALYPRSPFHEEETIPFVGTSIVAFTFVVAACFAGAVGLWQTMWESSRGTFLFLLHRPLTRETIFGTRLIVGAVATLLVATLPVVVYAWWAATPGMHASPFEWSMTASTWCWSGATTLLYLGAFLSGLRPARLFGSRFAPFVAGAVSFVMAANMSVVWSVVLTLVAAGCFVLAILWIGAVRDYS